MPLTTSRSEFFDAHLAELGVRAGMKILVHSSLVSFGRIDGGVATVYDALRRAVGAGGTIAVPTFTFHIRPEDVMDPATTPSRGFGALSEWLRERPGAQRSRCPIHGFAAIGPAAGVVADADETKSFGVASGFDVMHRAGFHLLLLGCTFQQGATYVHHVETLTGVPYREWVKLPRQLRDADGRVRPIHVDYYSRVRGTPWQPSLYGLQDAMIARQFVRVAKAPYGHSYLMDLDALHRTAAEMLSTNRYAFVAKDAA